VAAVDYRGHVSRPPAPWIQLGQHPQPSHTIAHFSDPHLLAGGRPLHDRVDTVAHLREALELVASAPFRPDAIVFTGDLTDLGEADAYERLKSLVEPVAAELEATIVWVMGNHDERAPYARVLFGEDHADEGAVAPQDRVYDIRGLRIVSLDSSIPGYHHGELERAQLDWLGDVLAEPAPHGTLLAMHHPPMPSPLNEPMAVLELLDQPALADVVRGTDVRGILAGHLHYSSHSTFAGVPVSVASATCYTMALGAPDRILAGVDAAQAIDVVSVYPDRLVHSTVPIGAADYVSGYAAEALERFADLDPVTRRELLSRKDAASSAAELLSAREATGEPRADPDRAR